MLIVLASFESAIRFDGAPTVVAGELGFVQLAKKNAPNAAIATLDKMVVSFFMGSIMVSWRKIDSAVTKTVAGCSTMY